MKIKPDLATKTDVVPIINVALVIVLTLMIISPSLNQVTTDVDLPEARATQTDEENKVEITCTLDGQIYLADMAVSPEEIASILGELLEENPGAIAVVRADKNLVYGNVERIIAEVEKAKPAEISLATTPQESGREEVDSRP
jgi:biopolymer transport protein ExbD